MSRTPISFPIPDISVQVDEMGDLEASDRQQLSILWNRVKRYWIPNSVFGHGADHASRVFNHLREIIQNIDDNSEGNPFLSLCSVCLIDIGLNRTQLRTNHVERSIQIARDELIDLGFSMSEIMRICEMIRYHSASVTPPESVSTNTLLVRDCDILDRLGFTGINMTLTYGQYINRLLFNSQDPLCFSGRKLAIDDFSIDYVIHSNDLNRKLSHHSTKEIGERKVRETAFFLSRFQLAYHINTDLGYRGTFDLLEDCVESFH